MRAGGASVQREAGTSLEADVAASVALSVLRIVNFRQISEVVDPTRSKRTTAGKSLARFVSLL